MQLVCVLVVQQVQEIQEVLGVHFLLSFHPFQGHLVDQGTHCLLVPPNLQGDQYLHCDPLYMLHVCEWCV